MLSLSKELCVKFVHFKLKSSILNDITFCAFTCRFDRIRILEIANYAEPLSLQTLNKALVTLRLLVDLRLSYSFFSQERFQFEDATPASKFTPLPSVTSVSFRLWILDHSMCSVHFPLIFPNISTLTFGFVLQCSICKSNSLSPLTQADACFRALSQCWAKCDNLSEITFSRSHSNEKVIWPLVSKVPLA